MVYTEHAELVEMAIARAYAESNMPEPDDQTWGEFMNAAVKELASSRKKPPVRLKRNKDYKGDERSATLRHVEAFPPLPQGALPHSF